MTPPPKPVSSCCGTETYGDTFCKTCHERCKSVLADKPKQAEAKCDDSRPVNPVGDGVYWSSLALTKREWDMLNMALIKTQKELIAIFGIDDFNYVYKWTKAVGSRP